MYYILFYKTIENYKEKRIPFREEHLILARDAYEKGNLIMAGAYDDVADGAALIFKADSIEMVENFAKNDPYVKNGLITEWNIRPWNVVIGNQ